KAMTRANVGPLSVRARVFGRGNSRVSAIVAHLSNHASRVLFGHLQAILRFLYDGGAQQPRLDADRDVPGGDQEDHRGAGDDDERLRGDRESDRLRLRHAAQGEQRPSRTGLHRGAGGTDRNRRRGGRGAEEAERERERAPERAPIQEQEDGGAAKRPRDGDQEQGGGGLLAALRVGAEPAADAPPDDVARARELRQEGDDDRGEAARDRDDEEAGADRPGARV